MIKGKYTSTEIIKQNNYKTIQRCHKPDGSSFILKSYKLTDKKDIEN